MYFQFCEKKAYFGHIHVSAATFFTFYMLIIFPIYMKISYVAIMIHHIPNRNIVTIAYSNLCPVTSKTIQQMNSQCCPWWFPEISMDQLSFVF